MMQYARHLWLLAMLATPLHAADCPADKPIKKTISSPMMTCTLLACASKLTCPSNGAGDIAGSADCFYMPSNDCNQCTATRSEICLSQEDFEKASTTR